MNEACFITQRTICYTETDQYANENQYSALVLGKFHFYSKTDRETGIRQDNISQIKPHWVVELVPQ